MTTFLTTRQIQELISVDRSTVYRMAEDGRLPAVKVGRQWRFPADRVAEQLGLTSEEPPTTPVIVGVDNAPATLGKLLVPTAAQAIAELFGDLLGIMAVITDIAGNPLTTVAHPCGLFSAIDKTPEAAEACVEGWRQLGEHPETTPQFIPSHLGFLCARAFIRVGPQLVGMVIVGGITPPSWPPSKESIERTAAELNMPTEGLLEVIDQTFDVDAEHQAWTLRMLPRVADLISQLASARSQLLSKLDAIAILAGPVAPQEGPTS